ncbi:MAG: hypothetical protein ACI9OJ_003682 [Myxococcota bacterium]
MKVVLRLLGGTLRLIWALISALVNAVYKILTRTALYLATAYLVVYFSLNADAVRAELMALLSNEVPGRMDCATLQWGPFPEDITIIDADIRDPVGTPVIRVEVVDTSIDLVKMQGWVLRKMLGQADRFELYISRAHTVGADVIVERDEEGWLGIEAAFDDVSKPNRSPGRAALIEIHNAVVKNGRFRLVESSSGVRIDARGLDVIDGEVLIDDGMSWIRVPQLLSAAGRLEVDGAGPDGGVLRLPWTNLQSRLPRWLHGELLVGPSLLQASESTIEIAGRLDTRPDRTTIQARATVTIAADEPIIAGFAGDRVQFEGSTEIVATGPLHWPTLTAQVAAKTLTIAGLNLGPIDLELSMRRDPFRRVAELLPFSMDLVDSVVHIDKLAYHPDNDGRAWHSALASVRFDDLLPERLWDFGFLTATLPSPLSGSLNGEAQLEAVALKTALGTLDWTVTATSQLTGNWDGDPSIPLAETWWVGGDARIELADETLVETASLAIVSGPHTAVADGQFNASASTVDVGLATTVDIGVLLERFGITGISGRAHLEKVRITGSAMNPNLRGTLRVSSGSVLDLAVERLTSAVEITDGRLDLRRLTASTQYGKLRTDAQLGLWDGDMTAMSTTMPLTLRRFEATNLNLADLGDPERLGLDALKGADLQGMARVSSRRFEMKLLEDGLAPSGNATVAVDALRIYGEPFTKFSTDVSADGHRIRLRDLNALASGGGSLSGSGWVDPVHKRLDVTADVEELDLATVAAIKRTGLPIRGTVSAHLEAKGSFREPSIDGSLDLSGFRYDGIDLGSARIDLHSRGTRSLQLSSRRFFRSLKLTNGTLKLSPGLIPSSLSVDVEIADLDVRRLLPALRKTVDQATVTAGQASVDIDFVGSDPFRLVVDLPDEAAVVRFGDNAQVTHDGPLWASLVGDIVSVERLVGRWGEQRLAFCGQMELGSTIDLDVAGSIDLHQIPNVRRYVTDLQGRVVTHDLDRTTDDDPFEGSCLQLAIDDVTRGRLGGPTGYIRVENALSAPVLTGTLRLDRVRGRPRALGRELAFDSGSLSFVPSAGAAGSQQVEIPEADPLRGSLDEGTFRLTGKAKLPEVPKRNRWEHWLPNKGFVRLQGEDIYWSVPKEYRVTFDPDLQLRFADLWQPEPAERRRLPSDLVASIGEPSLKLTGAVQVPEGAYFRSFTFLAQSLGTALGTRTVDAYSKDLSEVLPLLKETSFDVEIRGSNFLVKSDFGVGSTDLDTRFALDLRGTFENPRLVGNLEVTDGTITYSVFRRVFDVTTATLDFDGEPGRPKLLVRAETSIEAKKPGLAREGDQYEDYTVSVEVSGRVPDYKIALAAKPSLPEIDVQYLILLGKTKQQLADEGLAGTSIDVISPDLTSLIGGVIEAPFVDNLVLTPTLGGGRVEAIFRLGQRIRIGVVGRQEGGITTYDTRYRQKILDSLVLEAIRRGPGEGNRDRERYEVQLKYTVPLN